MKPASQISFACMDRPSFPRQSYLGWSNPPHKELTDLLAALLLINILGVEWLSEMKSFRTTLTLTHSRDGDSICTVRTRAPGLH